MNRTSPPYPVDPRTKLREAVRQLQRGELPAAERACDQALRAAPREPEALHLAGLIAHRRGDLAGARAKLRKTVKIQPRVARFHNSLGVVLRELGEAESARKALERAIRLRSGFAGAYYNLGLVHEELDDYRAALSAYEAACEHDSGMAGAHHARGLVLQALGRLDEAQGAFRRALEIQPAYPEAHFHLAHARRAEQIDDPQLAQIEALTAQWEGSSREAGWLYSALGKLNDDLGRYDQAFEAYHRANQLAAVKHDPEMRDKWAQSLIEAFSAERLGKESGTALDRTDRIFIVGMPRSGTTLLEAMLARHPDVEAGGEREELQAALTEAAEALELREPRQWAEAEPGVLEQAAKILDRHLAAPSGASMLTDKLPGNIWRLGLVGLLMPRAPILFTWRDPRDVGLSCYFTRFEKGQSFSYDLYHCGRQIQVVQRLAEHWLAALPNPVHVVSYEKLVTDPEDTILAALDCCGLDAAAAPDDHARGQEVVTTASSWQVRQGLYRRAINRWRHYEAHLEPLLRGLGSTALNQPL
ncbi:tetratricopeptide repeat protein [Wenzhouxiangella sp. XN201]|uniref:tetratricopeptide repeat-containing sulfotransferase family protein n=1 Tax=Wenzhouxiangella sp. XN201 TaxID=2710755 RepID=UPI0013C77EE1|nr:tetratricopeptide repeat-containing sulfotransferase family protein [Wenzhouxiangella sp. XN201]NEZ03128.1 tetratricopeptide repeat protein [Wenzhouxiangella sp. XN201]